MRRNYSLLFGLSCLTALAGACDEGITPPPPPAAGTGSPQTAAGTSPTPTGGTTGASGTGTTGAAGNAPRAGTGVSTGGTTGATAGTAAATSGTGGGTSGTGAGTAGTGGGATAGFKMCGKPAKEGTCKASAPGIYALKTEVDVWWRDENNTPTLYDPGRGKIVIYFKGEISDICEDGSGGKGVINACANTVPPMLTDATCGIIQILFPDEMWDKPNIPTFTTTGGVSGFQPGDLLTVAKAAGLVGLDLTDINGTFPTYNETATFTCSGGKTGKDCFPDHDGDMNPGITVKLLQEGTPPADLPYQCITPWKYVPAPTSVLGALDPASGAVDTYIGLRTRIGGAGKVGADCKSGTGAAEADGFDARVLDCRLKNGMLCRPAESQFVDKNQPSYHVLQVGQTPPAEWKHPRAEADAKLDRSPSKGPRSSVVRLGDLNQSVTCATVRTTQFPAFE